jgi:type II secretory pathway pseudopilin PulG
MPLLVLLSGPTTSQPDYSLLNLVLMGIYVGLTLVLAIVAVASIFISTRLSVKALAASDRQSREAIEAIQRQIDASEKQTKDTIEAVNRQIEASERQAQEALYNQHKPIVISVTNPSSHSLILRSIGNQHFGLSMTNKGAGVALNVYGIVGLDDFPEILCLATAKIIVHDADYPTPFDFKADGKLKYPTNEFEGVTVFPQGVFGYLRLMVTYSDLFNNQYLAVFDYSEEFGWRLKDEIKRVEKRLDEQVIIRH